MNERTEVVHQGGPREKAGNELVLDVQRISKHFGDLTALKEASLQVYETEVVACIGPSGSGKSTMVRCIGLLERIDAGAIFLDNELLGFKADGDDLRVLSDREIVRQRKRMGTVFQSFNLFSHMTVADNMVQPQMVAGRVDRKTAVARAKELLERVGLADKWDNYPSQLSGGQQQRVAIVRALAGGPRIMLFDEPTSALDQELVGEVVSVIRELAISGQTMVVVTHDLNFAASIADWCVFFEDGEIREQGPPGPMLNNPASERLKRFVSRVGAV